MSTAAKPQKGDALKDYITVAERIEKFYERHPEGRIITNIIEHDPERGFILMRADVYRNAEETLPTSTGHAYELKSEGYVQRTSYIEVCETSCVGRALALAGFEVKRGIASREEIEKAERQSQASQSGTKQTDDGPRATQAQQKIVSDLGTKLVELGVYADKKVAWADAAEICKSTKMAEWSEADAGFLIHRWDELKRNAEQKKAAEEAAKANDDIAF